MGPGGVREGPGRSWGHFYLATSPFGGFLGNWILGSGRRPPRGPRRGLPARLGSLKVWPSSLKVWPSSLEVWPSRSYGVGSEYGVGFEYVVAFQANVGRVTFNRTISSVLVV